MHSRRLAESRSVPRLGHGVLSARPDAGDDTVPGVCPNGTAEADEGQPHGEYEHP